MIQVPTDAASKIISTLRGTPMLLSLLLINLATFGMLTYLAMQSAEHRRTERAQILQSLERCFLLLRQGNQ